jgi:hypothetical protein
LLKKLSGGQRNFLLQTPEGDMLAGYNTKLDPVKHQGIVSLALGGARVQYEFADIPQEVFVAMSDGIAF